MNEINVLRQRYKFPSKEYITVMKKDKKNIFRKLEINTCKYYKLKSNKYLKKNLKLLGKINFPLYHDYITCLINNNIENIIDLRNKLQKYEIFVEEIDNILTGLNYDISNLKSKYMWHDIEITFLTQKNLNEYVNGVYKIKDKKYNNQIIMRVSKLEKKLSNIKNNLNKSNLRICKIKKNFESAKNIIVEFLLFLNDNFVESIFLKKLNDEIKSIIDFFSNSDDKVKLNLNYFKDDENNILRIPSIKDKEQLRQEFLIIAEEKLFKNYNYDYVPFIPEFYDIAYDYFTYPSTNENLNELLEKVNIN